MKHILILLFAAAPALADTCPPAPDLDPEKTELMEAVRAAPSEMSARQLTNRLWELWSLAPDSYAQELLDEGMERRASYDFDGALKAFDALIAYCPDYAEGYNQRAFVRFLREEYDSALEDLDRVLEISPDHIAALAGRALTLMGQGEIDAGQQALRDALKLNPWLPERHMLIPDPGQDI